MKRELGDVWKEDDGWKIQMPKGIWTTKTKKEAEHVSSLIYTNPKKEKRIEFLDALGDYIKAEINMELSYRDNPEYGGDSRETIEALDALEEKLELLLNS